MTPDPVVHVALATNTTYLPWCAVAVLSCMQSTPARVHAHILDEGDLSPEQRHDLHVMTVDAGGDLTFHTVDDDRLGAVPTKGPDAGGRTSWIRILLPDMLAEVERVIYLDADTLTVDSLLPLWTLRMADMPIAAVSNVVEPVQRPHIERLGFTDSRHYFNAGVLVMNLSLMRDEHMYDGIVNCVASRGDELSWYDQDALNLVFAGRWLDLPPRWNAQNSLWYWETWATEIFGAEAVRAAQQSPAILHFEGPSFVKPWHYLSHHPFRPRYLATLAATPWHGEPVVGRTTVTRAIRLLPPARQMPAYASLLRMRARVERRTGWSQGA